MDQNTQTDHVDCIRKILKKGKSGNVHYIWGNHDEFMHRFSESRSFGGIHLSEREDYIASDGRRYLVLHGHQFDLICKYKIGTLISKIGDIGYEILINVNDWYNWIRRKLGLQYSSLSKYIKVKFKKQQCLSVVLKNIWQNMQINMVMMVSFVGIFTIQQINS